MKAKDSDIISIKTKLSAPVEEAWRAWTEPLLIMKWFGSDPDGIVLNAALDVRPGGHFEITFKDSNGTQHTCSGIYEDVQKYNKLSFTWKWKSEPGVQSFVTVLLSPENNVTLMQFEHAHIGYGSAHNYLQGWKNTFLKLEHILTA